MRPFEGVKLSELRQTAYGCPTEWIAKGPGGEYVYIRYRYGFLVVEFGVNEDALSLRHGGSLGGIMDTQEMLELTGFTV